MPKMTVAQAAEHFKISKEAIHNRIRRGTLNSVIENGVKYVLLPDEKPTTHPDSRFYDYIEQENGRLKEKTERLEAEIDRLRDQREAMLIAEREKIEQIYKERDAQLKSVLEVFASKLLPPHAVDAAIEESVESVEENGEVVDVDLPDNDDPFAGDDFDDLVSLKDFLKLKDFGKKKRQRIKKRFKTHASEDARILVREGTLYLRPYHYDYSDLLE